MKHTFDIIIAGAGPGGSVLARKAALAGFRVALLDVKNREDIGYPWESAVENQVFHAACLKLPDPADHIESPQIYKFYSGKLPVTSHNRKPGNLPGKKPGGNPEDIPYPVEMDAEKDSVFYINHKILNQQLLDLAVDAGVSFFPGFEVADVLSEENIVYGVSGVRKKLLHRGFSFNGKIIVDATGSTRALSSKLPVVFMFPESIPHYDLASGYQETRELNESQADELAEKLGIEKGVYYVNVGVHHGFQVMFLRGDLRLTMMFGASLGEQGEDAMRICHAFCGKYPFLGKRISGGGKLLITRRSTDTMAGNGFLCLGEAACQNVPTIGSGISSAIHAADLAMSTIAHAFNNDTFTMDTLWDYNRQYQTGRGAIMASYDVIRLFLQHLSLKNVHTFFASGLLTDRNFIQLYGSARIIFDTRQIMDIVSRLASNPALVSLGIASYQALSDSEKVLKQYQHYPVNWDPKAFYQWRYKTNMYFKKYHYFKEFDIQE